MTKMSTVLYLHLKRMNFSNGGSKRRRREKSTVIEKMGKRSREMDHRQQERIIIRRSPSPL